MHLRLHLDTINEITTTKPFEVVELSISRKNHDNSALPCIRLYFSKDQNDLANLDFKNSENRTLRCIEFKPKGKFLYREVRQAVQNDFKFCKAILEFEKNIDSIDVYCDLIKA